MSGSRATHIIANPTAASGRVKSHWGEISRRITQAYGLGGVDFTDDVGHAVSLTAEAIATGAKRIVVVGGDGTINEVVNGYIGADGASAGIELAIYPCGTGGDLARSLALHRDGEELPEGLESRLIDAGCLIQGGADTGNRRYFLNISSVGASADIVSRVNRSSKRWGARASFVWATVRGLAASRPEPVRIRIDDRFEEERQVALIAVANGRYFGGGMCVAPDAYLDDGALDVVVMGEIGALTFLRHGPKIYRGEHGVLPEISMYRGRCLHVSSRGPGSVLVETDGELAGCLNARFEVVPRAVRVLLPATSSPALRG